MNQENFVGNMLSLDCGESLGIFQGVVTAVSKEKQTISLKDTFRNGIKYEVPEVTIRAVDIKDLKILKIAEVGPQEHENDIKELLNGGKHLLNGKGLISKAKHAQHDRKSHSKSPMRKEHLSSRTGSASVGNTPHKGGKGQRQSAFHSPVGKRKDNKSDAELVDDDFQIHTRVGRSKSFSSTYRQIRRDGTPEKFLHKKGGPHFTVGGDSTDEEVPRTDRGRRRHKSVSQPSNCKYRSSPLKIEGKHRSSFQKKNEECFSAPVESFMDDFDFGENLARFDKAAVFEEIDAMTDGASFGKKREKFLKANENVLDDEETPELKGETVAPAKNGGYFYLTENGIKVPAISATDRAPIFAEAENEGFSRDRRIEIVGVCSTQLVLGLLGGCQRLKPGNKHQKPTVVVLCGSHTQGAQGVCCGRHLSQHNAKVIVCVPDDHRLHKDVKKELKLFRETEGEIVLAPKELPGTPVDLIISALNIPAETSESAFSKSATHWATQNSKARILSIDPCKHQKFNSKWSIFVGLPLHGSASLGNIYLCDAGIPKRFYNSLGEEYIFPFGSKFVIPLEDT